MALEVLRIMREAQLAPNAITLNAVVRALSDGGEWQAAVDVVNYLNESDEQSNMRTFVHLMHSLGKAGEWRRAERVFERLTEAGVRHDPYSYKALFHVLVANHRYNRAMELLRGMADVAAAGATTDAGREAVCAMYSGSILQLRRRGEFRRALRVYEAMKEAGVAPQLRTCHEALVAAAYAADWARVDALLAEMAAHGLTPDEYTCSMLVAAASMRDDWRRALGYKDRMRALGVKPTQHTYAPLAGALGRAGEWQRAVALLEDMRAQHAAPNRKVYAAVLEACAACAQGEAALEVWTGMGGAGVEPDVHVCNTVVLAMARAGDFMHAVAFVDGMRVAGLHPDTTTYAHLVTACAASGETVLGADLVREQVAAGVPVAEAALSALVEACGSAGEWERVTELRGVASSTGVSVGTAALDVALRAAAAAGSTEQVLAALQDAGANRHTPSEETCAQVLRDCAASDGVEVAAVARALTAAGVDDAIAHALWVDALAAVGQWREALDVASAGGAATGTGDVGTEAAAAATSSTDTGASIGDGSADVTPAWRDSTRVQNAVLRAHCSGGEWRQGWDLYCRLRDAEGVEPASLDALATALMSVSGTPKHDLAVSVYHDLVRAGTPSALAAAPAAIMINATEGKWGAAAGHVRQGLRQGAPTGRALGRAIAFLLDRALRDSSAFVDQILRDVRKSTSGPAALGCLEQVIPFNRQRRFAHAVRVYEAVADGPARPAARITNAYLHALGALGMWRQAVETLRGMGDDASAYSYTSAIHACASARQLKAALELLQSMRDRGVAAADHPYNAAINAVRHAGGTTDDVLDILRAMDNDGVEATDVTYIAALTAVGRLHHAPSIEEVVRRMRSQEGLAPSTNMFNATITALGHAGKPDEARRAFDAMPSSGVRRDARTYVSLAKALGYANRWDEAVAVMQSIPAAARRDEVTYAIVIAAAMRGGRADVAKAVLHLMAEAGIAATRHTSGAMRTPRADPLVVDESVVS